MDIDRLSFFLKEEYNYQETTKDVFTEKLTDLFKDFKKGGDAQLIVY